MAQSAGGLRELKKQMTRAAIANAALDLTLENGFSHLTIEGIAHRAFVSPRTFSNYFSCKEEAVIAAGNQYWADVVNRFAEQPADRHPLRAIRDLITDALKATEDENLSRATQTIRLGREHPALRPYQFAEYAKLEESLRRTVASRSGTDSETDLYPWLVAAAAVAATKAAVALWLLRQESPDTLPGIIEAAFDQIAGGLRAPAES
jgi:AcrR family transcriptional regulator